MVMLHQLHVATDVFHKQCNKEWHRALGSTQRGCWVGGGECVMIESKENGSRLVLHTEKLIGRRTAA